MVLKKTTTGGLFFFKNPCFSQPCFPHIQHINYFSDGCTGHYNAYKNFPHLTYHTSKISALMHLRCSLLQPWKIFMWWYWWYS